MNWEELKKEFKHDYFVIVTGTILGTLIYCTVFEPDASFSIWYLFWVLVFSVAGDLPLILFYSKKELSEQQWLCRFIAHFLTLELLLLVLGYFSDMYSGIIGGIVFALLIAGVYILVRLTCLQADQKVAVKINAQLKDLEEDEDNSFPM